MESTSPPLNLNQKSNKDIQNLLLETTQAAAADGSLQQAEKDDKNDKDDGGDGVDDDDDEAMESDEPENLALKTFRS